MKTVPERLTTLEQLYAWRCTSKDAMSPHMSTLRKLASECEVCVEFGVRRANSTIALLAGCKGEVHSYDPDLHWPKLYQRIADAVGKRWTMHLQDSVTADVPPCDLLLHDSLHSAKHVAAELEAHAHKVRRYIVFHDSVACGDVGQAVNGKSHPAIAGIMQAIDAFLENNDDEWQVLFHHRHSNGLLCLVRRPASG